MPLEGKLSKSKPNYCWMARWKGFAQYLILAALRAGPDGTWNLERKAGKGKSVGNALPPKVWKKRHD